MPAASSADDVSRIRVPSHKIRQYPTQKPVWQYVETWLLLWPLLILIARQAIILAGPARMAVNQDNPAAMAAVRGTHYYVYLDTLYFLSFVVAGYRQILLVLRQNALILATLLLAAGSAMWSASPIVTVEMSFKVGICALFACYLSTRLSTEQLMDLLMFMGLASAGLSILFVLALPSYGLFAGYAGGAWQGICNHKNTLGISMAYLLTPVFFKNGRRRGQRLLYAILLLFIIFKCQSRGAWIDTLGVLLFVGWLYLIRALRDREALLLVVLTTVIAVVIVTVGIVYFSSIVEVLGKDPSMGGRTDIYQEVWRSILKRPLLGYGFGAFWTADGIEANRIRMAVGWPIGYAESGLLEVALQIGLIGLGITVLMFGRAIIQAARLLRSRFYTPRVGWFLTMLFLALLTNIDAGWILTVDTLDWVLILIACIGLERETRLAKEAFALGAVSPSQRAA
jgi:exopolysaccharide production protein ExoQ